MSATAAQRRELKKKVGKVSNGLFGYTTDFLLFFLYMTLKTPGKPYGKGVYLASIEAEDTLAKFNYSTLKSAVRSLQKRGLIRSLRSGLFESQITKEGIERMQEKVPSYKTERTWDKLIYIINYDIPRKKNWYRKKLLGTLRDWGAAQIQESLYLTAYNPKRVLQEFQEANGIFGELLISTLTEESSIGEKTDIRELLWEYYELEIVNNNYRGFINEYSRKKIAQIDKADMITKFLSIVKRDPQLPFELLLDDYAGDQAYLLIQKVFKNKK